MSAVFRGIRAATVSISVVATAVLLVQVVLLIQYSRVSSALHVMQLYLIALHAIQLQIINAILASRDTIYRLICAIFAVIVSLIARCVATPHQLFVACAHQTIFL
jgi:uncharacterized protein YhhL (DUF1145 family)